MSYLSKLLSFWDLLVRLFGVVLVRLDYPAVRHFGRLFSIL